MVHKIGQPFISIIIPVHNGLATLPRCLQAVAASDYPHYECIVVDDGSTDETPQIARSAGAQVIPLTDGPHGPAYARNQGARAARGDYLYFMDADVVIYPDTLSTIVQTFREHPDVDAIFGSYDDLPAGTGFLAQYRNLQHHFVHQQGREEASTFWSGCGAMERTLFLELGGFDHERYPRPSIEDIDLGYRVRAQGRRILLNKQLQVKHLKEWNLKGMLRTDILDRAIPWTRLIVQAQNLPNDLNLELSQRVSAGLSGLLVLFLLLHSLRPEGLAMWLLLVFFLSLLDGWEWQRRPQQLRKDKTAVFRNLLLLGGLSALAAWAGQPFLLWLWAAVTGLLLLGWLLPGATVPPRLLYVVVTILVGVALVLLLASYPLWVLLPVVLLALLIVLLNHRFYLFFWQARGPAFACATFPLQILYYLYSTAAFVLVNGQHYWQSNFKTNLVESVE